MSLLRRVSFSHSAFARKTSGIPTTGKKIFRLGLFLLAIPMLGCGDQAGGVVKESDEYSYDDIMAQAAKEELASEAEREK